MSVPDQDHTVVLDPSHPPDTPSDVALLRWPEDDPLRRQLAATAPAPSPAAVRRADAADRRRRAGGLDPLPARPRGPGAPHRNPAGRARHRPPPVRRDPRRGRHRPRRWSLGGARSPRTAGTGPAPGPPVRGGEPASAGPGVLAGRPARGPAGAQRDRPAPAPPAWRRSACASTPCRGRATCSTTSRALVVRGSHGGAGAVPVGRRREVERPPQPAAARSSHRPRRTRRSRPRRRRAELAVPPGRSSRKLS